MQTQVALLLCRNGIILLCDVEGNTYQANSWKETTANPLCYLQG
jgi:hypothetical protein